MEFSGNLLVGVLVGVIPVIVGWGLAQWSTKTTADRRRKDAEANARIKAMLKDDVRPSDLL